jgi:hypothetical protein
MVTDALADDRIKIYPLAYAPGDTMGEPQLAAASADLHLSVS